MQKPKRHTWEEGSTHRGVAGKEYDEVWDYVAQLETKNRRSGGGVMNHRCIHFNGGLMMVSPKSKFTDEQILNKRRFLAKQWRCKLDMVMDIEAIGILEQEAEIKRRREK